MPLATRETSDAWIDRQCARFAEHGVGYWAVELRETGQLVGAVGLSRVTYEAHFTPAVGAGWRLARRYWGYGYASEAAEAAMTFGFEDLRLDEIVAVTVPANIRSQQVMRRFGNDVLVSRRFRPPASAACRSIAATCAVSDDPVGLAAKVAQRPAWAGMFTAARDPGFRFRSSPGSPPRRPGMADPMWRSRRAVPTKDRLHQARHAAVHCTLPYTNQWNGWTRPSP